MERYESKEIRISRPAAAIYNQFSRLDAFTPFVEGKVEGWEATEDTCSLRVQGFKINMRVAERVPGKLVRVAADEGTPIQFSLIASMDEPEPGATILRLTLEVELNMMMKMMLGGKLQQAMDSIGDTLSQYIH